jgi:hypothetical protein
MASKAELELKNKNIAELNSWDEALKYLALNGVDVLDSERTAELLDDGFTFLQDKSKLVNVPFVILECKFGMSSNYQRKDEETGNLLPTPYAKVWVMTQTQRRYKFVDMSSGIAEQLNNAKRALGRDPKGLIIAGGLNPSHYEIETDEGTKKATTFYLSVGE